MTNNNRPALGAYLHPERGKFPPALPSDFWEDSPVLRHVRQAAWSMAKAPTPLLMALLARISSQSHRLVVPPVAGNYLPLSTFAALVGGSGTGKSSVIGGAKRLVPADPENVVEGAGATAAGLVENLYTYVKTDEGTEKRQTKHGMLVTLDEGGALADIAGRQGDALLPTLRAAWTGMALGEMNADMTRRRFTLEMNYATGVIIGFQPTTAQVLLAENLVGTPQRFLWAGMIDPTIPNNLPEWPGRLPWSADLPTGLHVEGLADRVVMVEPPAGVAERIKAEQIAISQGNVEVDPGATQRNVLMLKTSALLAWLEGNMTGNRLPVTSTDWQRAEQLVDLSEKVQSWTEAENVRYLEERATEAAKARAARSLTEDEYKDEQLLDHAAISAARLVHKNGNASNLSSQLTARHRKFSIEEILERAQEFGYVIRLGRRKAVPGPVTPPGGRKPRTVPKPPAGAVVPPPEPTTEADQVHAAQVDPLEAGPLCGNCGGPMTGPGVECSSCTFDGLLDSEGN